MRFPLHITTDMVAHQLKQSMQGHSRYPFVLMLEPLYTCNLACIGCSTERHTGKLSDRLPLETCLKAVDDCGAPSVSILIRNTFCLPTILRNRESVTT